MPSPALVDKAVSALLILHVPLLPRLATEKEEKEVVGGKHKANEQRDKEGEVFRGQPSPPTSTPHTSGSQGLGQISSSLL